MVKRKLSKLDNDLMSYMLTSKNKGVKESGEFVMNQNFTIDASNIPKTTKEKGLRKSKPSHKRTESASMVSFVKPKIVSTINNSFVSKPKGDYSTSISMKHQRRASDALFSKRS